MKKANKIFDSLMIFVVMLFVILSEHSTVIRASTSELNELNSKKISEIEELVEQQMRKGKIPGLSVCIVNGNQTVYQAGFGYSNLKTKEPVTPDTLFEIGSNSKAFTALAVLKLQDDGRININDPITKYIPWLILKYRGKEVQVTIEEFLHHTSGVSFSTIDSIPKSNADTALEETVGILSGSELAHKPGEQFEYATINYDVLGLLIQKVSGLSYEEYIEKYIFQPIGLYHTYIDKSEEVYSSLAQGYRVSFSKARAYNAPSYRGNTPAGYIMSCGQDMSTWLKAQLNTLNELNFNKELIDQSHIPNVCIKPLADGTSYAAGWFVYDYEGTEISHSGSNPNYSSYIVFRPEDHMGVAVMSNTNSGLTEVIGQAISRLLREKEVNIRGTEFNIKVDQISMAIVSVSCIVIALMLFSNLKTIYKIIHKKALIRKRGHLKRVGIIVVVLVFACICYFLSVAPYYFYRGVSWNFAFVWLPGSVKVAIILVYISIIFIFLRCIEAKIWITRIQNDKDSKK